MTYRMHAASVAGESFNMSALDLTTTILQVRRLYYEHMRIAVIAANGRAGQAFVDAALKAGHDVRAGIRGADSFKPNDHLTTVQCDATNESDVTELMRSTDVVVSLLGHVKGSPARVQTNATRTVLQVMQKKGLKRIISLTGTGVRIEGDKPDIMDKLANAFIARVDPNRVQDGIEHAQALQESQADFTIVRVLKLTNGRSTEFDLTEHGPAAHFTSRSQVAQAILECIEDNRFLRSYPVVSPAAH